MGKILKKFSKTDGIYIILSIVNMYIIPFVLLWVILNKAELQLYIRKLYDIGISTNIFNTAGLYFLGCGGIVQAILTALYEKHKKENNETALWIMVLLSVPLVLCGFLTYLHHDTVANEVAALAGPVAVPVFAAAGMWLGRLAAGKYKGIKQFDLSDKIFTGISVLLFGLYCLNMFANLPFDVETGFVCILFIFGLACAAYSRFSDFEYLTDKLVRAVVTGFVVFLPCGAVYRILSNITNMQLGDKYYENMQYVMLAAPLAAVAAFIGVLTGYYLRIMKVGGDGILKKIPFSKKVKGFFKAAAIFAAVICILYIYAQNRYWFSRKNVNVWDVMGIDENDIYALRVEKEHKTDFFDDMDNDDAVITVDRAAIHKIVETLKAEKGTRCAFTDNKKDCEPFYIYACDKDRKVLFEISVDTHWCGEYWVNWDMVHGYVGYLYLQKYANILIPAQYYGKQPTKGDFYYNTAKKAKLKGEDREKFINDSLNSQYYLIMYYGCDPDNKDPKVRAAVADLLGTDTFTAEEDDNYGYWSLRALVDDEDENVKSKAFISLGNYKREDAMTRLYGAVNTETNEKTRFCAILGYAESIFINEKNGDDARKYFKTMADNADNSIFDRLASFCALVRLGEEEYRDEIEILLDNIEDEEIKTEVRRFLEE